jgi:excisionase family DNA binding protein
MNDVTTDRWLSVDEIAAYLGVKRYTIYKWIERKNMPAHKVGSLWKFKKDEIDNWIRDGKAAEPYVSPKPK